MILRRMLHYHPLQKGITKQINYILDYRNRLRETLTTKELEEWDTFMERYITKLVEYKSNLDISDFPRLPFVTIGSRVRLVGCNQKIWTQVSVCYPEREQEKWGMFSFASCNGKRLLLLKVDDRVSLETERGQIDVRIHSIEFMDW